MHSPRIPLFVSALSAVTLIMSSPISAAECARPGDNAVVSWSGGAPGAEQVRAYFRSDLSETEHFVEMRQETGTTLNAVLPKASSETTRIEYRIASVTKDSEKTLFRGHIAVSDSCAVKVAPTSAERLVVGSTSRTSIIPSGFECSGIVGTVSSDGNLRAYRGCREQTVVSGTGTNEGQPTTKTATNVAGKKSGESFHGGNKSKAPKNGAVSPGGGHVDHGNGLGLGHCKDNPGVGHEGHDHPPCEPVSNSRPN